MEFTVTTTGPGPEGAANGTRATIPELLQLVIEVAWILLKVSVLVPWLAPKLEPTTVTLIPVAPNPGDTPETTGLVPIVTEALSKVAVASIVLSWLQTTSPM